MPKVTQEHVEDRRRQILDAAYRCFSEKGFHATTMREVCHEAGLSAGAVYGYFEGKQEIVETLGRTGREATRSFLEGLPAEDDDAPGALTDVLCGLIEYLGTPEAERALRLELRLWGEALHNPALRELFRSGLGNMLAPVAELLEAGRSEGTISNELDLEAVGRLCIAVFLGLVVQKALEPDADLEPCADVVRSWLTCALAAEGEPT